MSLRSIVSRNFSMDVTPHLVADSQKDVVDIGEKHDRIQPLRKT